MQRIRNLREYGKYFHLYCENKVNQRNKRIESSTAVKDQKKEILYGQPEFLAPFLKSTNNSPQRNLTSASPEYRASPTKQSPKIHRKPIAPTNGRPSVLQSPSPNPQALFISQIDNYITLPLQQPRRSVRREANLTPAPGKTLPAEFSTLPRTRKESALYSSIERAPAPKASQRSDRLNKTIVAFATEETGSFYSPVSKRTATLSPVLKTEGSRPKFNNNATDSERASPTTTNSKRKHITNKFNTTFIRDEQKYFIHIDANVKKMKERGIIDLTDTEQYSFFSENDNSIIKNPKQRYKVLKERVHYTGALKPSLPFREVTISDRIKLYQRAQTPSKPEQQQQLSQSPTRTENIHLEKLRGYNNLSRIFQTQVKILNSIAKEGSYNQYAFICNQTGARSHTPNPAEKQFQFKFDSASNYLNGDIDHPNTREETQRSSERVMPMRARGNGK